MSSAGAKGPRYYRFVDAGGRTHLVDSIDSVPQALRAHAVCIEYHEEPSLLPSVLAHPSPSAYQTFGLGFAAALLAVFVFSRLPGTLRWFVRAAILCGVFALLAGAYLGWMRRATHASSDVLTGPGAIIDDAKEAVAKMNARMAAQQAELKEIEQAK